jgi:predicted secreted Zn-dependent protease
MAAWAIAAAWVSSAAAQPVMHTHYTYYPVSGHSLREIHRAMETHGPIVNGMRSYGVTIATPGREMSVSTCKAMGHYVLAMDVVIELPKVVNAGALSAGEVEQWNRFAQFVKKHEQTHRAIWGDGAAEMERKFLAGNTGDCAAAHSRAMKLWDAMVAAYRPRQLAFDMAQRSVLRAHPFMKYASR